MTDTVEAWHSQPSVRLCSFPDTYRCVVAGASGGIGSAIAGLVASDPFCADVVALSRASKLSIDLEVEASIAEAAASIGRHGPIHLFIDATGLLHDSTIAPEKTVAAIDADAMAKSFAINAGGPALLLKHFHRYFPRDGRCVFATLSARVGSISDNRLGGWYSYRASKAALNMIIRTAAIEIARKRPGAVILALHPGTVRTPLSDPFSRNRERTEPVEAAQALLKVIDQSVPQQSGAFLAYDGTTIPW